MNLLASLSGQLAQQVRDFEVDSRTVTTFATACGRPVAIITLRLVTALLLVTSVAGFATGLIPWRLAPLALAFPPFAFSRLRSDYSQPPSRLVCLASLVALLYIGGLVVAQMD